jgi:hypothetical protein
MPILDRGAVPPTIQSQRAERRRQQRRAHKAVHVAKLRGELVEPDRCQECGATGVWIDCHHNCYCEQHKLDCRFICARCHAHARHPADASCVYEEATG